MGPTTTAAWDDGRAAAAPPFELLYDAHVDAVWRTLARLGVEPAFVEDAAQEVFITAWKRYGDFAGRSSVRTWLIGICLHVGFRARRSSDRRHAREEHVTPPRPSPAPDDALRFKEEVEQLQALLRALPEEQRDVFVLMELEELSAPEVSELLSVPLNTVYSRLRLARASFNARVEQLEAQENER